MQKVKSPARFSASFALRRLLNAGLDWFYPSNDTRCTLCGRPMITAHKDSVAAASGVSDNSGHEAAELLSNLVNEVCLFCLQDAFLSPGVRQASMFRLPVPDGGYVPMIAATEYAGLVRHVIREWKYDGALNFTALLAWWIAQAVQTQGQAIDVIVPVPTTSERVKQRGYHHVLLLAERISRQLNVPAEPGLLQRTPDVVAHDGRISATQTAKNAVLRRESLKGAFYVPETADIRRCAGKRILLVDDVVTTGSTLGECANALIRQGLRDVICAAVARVE